MATDRIQVAVDYVRRGWPVLPLHAPTGQGCSCRTKNCGSVAKHPRTRQGLKDASLDEARVREWWKKWPEANIGVVTGAISALVVLDVDDKDNGKGSASLSALEAEHGALPRTLSCTTGCGRHLYFRHPGRPVKSSTGKLGMGIDVRADGGYVVAPPSTHSNGNLYCWLKAEADITPIPDWLLRLVNADRSSTDFAVGSRNESLTRLGGQLRARGMDQKGIEAELLEANATLSKKPLPLPEVRGIAASIAKYAPGKPKLPWFQFYPSDWLSNNAVRWGCDFQRGWLIQLVAECWRQGGVLPNDPDMLWMCAGAASKEAFEHAGHNLLVLSQFEPRQLEDGAQVLVHPWLAEHYQKQARNYLNACAGGAASAASRKRKKDQAVPEDDLDGDWVRQDEGFDPPLNGGSTNQNQTQTQN
jgi:bifunctional DNA primase/polymerase-like protein/primase-like protein